MPRQYGRVSLTPPLPTSSPPDAGQLAPNYPAGPPSGASGPDELPGPSVGRVGARTELPDWPAVVDVLVPSTACTVIDPTERAGRSRPDRPAAASVRGSSSGRRAIAHLPWACTLARCSRPTQASRRARLSPRRGR